MNAAAAAAAASSELLEIALGAARAASRLLLARAGDPGRIDTKSSATDPVSEADQAAERLLVQSIGGARPEDGLLGEEGSDTVGSSGYRWVLDPIDGTVNFLYGLPLWAVSVACEVQAEDGSWDAVVGVVAAPALDWTAHAVRGEGAWCGDQALSVRASVPAAGALVATGFSYDAAVRSRQAATVARLIPSVRDLRRMGSAAIDCCLVARGEIDAYYEDSTQRWDWAAGALIAREAGAVMSPLAGPEGGEGLLLAPPGLHDELAALLDEGAGT